MTSIIFLKGTIYCDIFRYNYLRKKKFFSIFFFIFGIRSDFEDFPEKDLPHSWCIFELTDSEKRG